MTSAQVGSWFLEGLASPGSPTWRTRIDPLPFRIGRRSTEHLTLESGLVSGRHAELFERSGGLWVRDLGSTNGTFRNGSPVVGEEQLEVGDVLVFGDQEFRLVEYAEEGFRTTRVFSSLDIQPWMSHAGELQQQLSRREIEVHLQPIRRLADETIVGYEVLGRGHLGGEAVGPVEMFATASLLGAIPQLCHEYRRAGLAACRDEPAEVALLLNTHPVELEEEADLVEGLAELRREYPSRRLILEIHEAAATDSEDLKRLGGALRELAIDLAFDDFGTGRDRLVALAETAPRLLKFDVAMVRSLDQVSRRRREMVRRLVSMVQELGIATLAEGVETAGELEACRELGFEFGQGYLLGRPARFSPGAWN